MLYLLISLFVIQAVLSALLIPAFSSDSSKCATYDSPSNTINVVCDTNISGIYNDIEDKNILERESEGVWILNAVIDVHPTAKLIIDYTDTDWLKITNNDDPNFITISGNAEIDGVTITSWDSTNNDVIRQNSTGSIPRPYIRIEIEGEVVLKKET